jgi:uncharacterized protein YdhG (YjbR/CyaY superfamily)
MLARAITAFVALPGMVAFAVPTTIGISAGRPLRHMGLGLVPPGACASSTWRVAVIARPLILTSGGEYPFRNRPGDSMATDQARPQSIDEYIAAFSPEVRTILERIRLAIAKAAPEAQESISYRIPTFTLSGALVYFAAFKKHIGFYPPVRGDAGLEKAVAPYAGDKGNLRFLLDQPIPYGLIERIVRLRVKQNLAQAAARSKKRR